MYLFYVVDGLDIKKIEKNEKKWIFLYQTLFSRFFRFFPLHSRRRFNPARTFNNIGINFLAVL